MLSINFMYALGFGLIRKLGWPRFSKEYMDMFFMAEDVHIAGILVIAILTNWMTMHLLCWIPVVVHGIFV